jgi:hypothetical protein
MSEKANIYQKLQTCRVELAKKSLKKTGKNLHSKYSYYELGDFLPTANEIMLNNGLVGLFKPNLPGDDVATLTIINLDNTVETHIFSSSVSVAKLNGVQEIQNIGATQTYMRRYLYTMALEIAESDPIEPMTGQPIEEPKEVTFDEASKIKIGFGKHKGMTLIDIMDKHPDYVSWYLESGTDEKIKTAFKVIENHLHGELDFETVIDSVKIETLKKMIVETDTKESEFLKFCKVERYEDITTDTFVKAMQMLEAKKEKQKKSGESADLPQI